MIGVCVCESAGGCCGGEKEERNRREVQADAELPPGGMEKLRAVSEGHHSTVTDG